MRLLIWLGVAFTVAGLLGLLRCIQLVRNARRSGLDDDAMRAAIQKAITLNMGALGVSALGLMMVVAGIILG